MQTQHGLRIEWKMSRSPDGKRLLIDYTVTNGGKERAYLCDELVVRGEKGITKDPKAIIVANGDEAGRVRFVRGMVPVDKPTAFDYRPGGRAMDPGQKLTGHAESPLPLKAWHNYGYLTPIRGTPRSAVLEIAYVVGAVRWSEMPLEDGRVITVTQPGVPLLTLRGDSRPIP